MRKSRIFQGESGYIRSVLEDYKEQLRQGKIDPGFEGFHQSVNLDLSRGRGYIFKEIQQKFLKVAGLSSSKFLDNSGYRIMQYPLRNKGDSIMKEVVFLGDQSPLGGVCDPSGDRIKLAYCIDAYLEIKDEGEKSLIELWIVKKEMDFDGLIDFLYADLHN
ncbi:TPA: hypothetical protein QCY10_003764 [Bacillus mobilis]|uniref:hypothetical protein n=1 Tax=Bacillus cereus TaxID=1396 RepID=UPI001E2D579B|nr:hypothetical protein [Bacillus cereus]HDR7875917.1 hypothetical protein [Bacillus mobilis]